MTFDFTDIAALFQVILIDLALAGDNAVAVGLAAAGGGTMFPIEITDWMFVQSLTIHTLNVASARSWEWRLYKEPNGGSATANEVAGINGTASPWKRVSELKKAGIIEPTGRQATSTRGAKVTEYQLTEFGRSEYARIIEATDA